MLTDHELAVIFAERALRRTIAGVGEIGALRPLPDIAEYLPERAAVVSQGRGRSASRDKLRFAPHRGGNFPFDSARQAPPGPALRKGVDLIVAHVRDGRRET
jgi:hypothetical protein